MLERRSPLEGHPLLPTGKGARRTVAGTAGANLSLRHPLALLQVSSFAGAIDTAAARLAELVGVATPSANRFSGGAVKSIRAIGPGIWQVVGDIDAVPSATSLRHALEGIATVVDLGHARVVFRLSGTHAPRVLAKHCGLDLDQRTFPTGSATGTRFDMLGMTLARIDDTPTFELMVFRGYAAFVLESLVESASEFGVAIEVA